MTRTLFALAVLLTAGCAPAPTSNDTQRERQNTVLNEGASRVGIPAIHNFRELRLVKMLYELRDEELSTYTYVYSDMTGKWVFFCDSVGYGIPYAAQLTADETVQRYYLPSSGNAIQEYGHDRLPQAEPNGIFPPASAEGTWVFCKDPKGTKTAPVYVEPRIIVSPFKLP